MHIILGISGSYSKCQTDSYIRITVEPVGRDKGALEHRKNKVLIKCL